MNPSPLPSLRSRVLVPALVTLAVTLLRLGLELAGGPQWLANAGTGGAGAVLGIAWLPLLFGPWFHQQLRAHRTGKALWAALAKTLLVYGLCARIPVVLVTLVALAGDWGTHYEKFPFEAGFAGKVGATLLAQLVFWAGVWTVGVGMLAAAVAGAWRRTPTAATA